ncbi:MAG TPA: DUF1684 domain-containing protein [Thermoanaerobaculia bacterium]
MTAPSGWLSVVGLQWLEEGENRIGADFESDEAAPTASVVVVVSGDATASRRGSAATLWQGAEATPLEPDLEGERPFLTHGSVSFSLISRGGRLGVRIRDRDAAARRPKPNVSFFPVDAAWRIPARFEPYDPPRRSPVASVAGTADAEIFPGAVVFARDGVEHRLDVIAERGETDSWIVFGDATNGRETYGGGRFVYAPPPIDGGTVVDFNKAYNPPCVFTPFSTCPLPLPQNRLTFPVRAGERILDF